MQGRDGGRAGVVGAARKEKPQRGGQPGRRYNRQKKAEGAQKENANAKKKQLDQIEPVVSTAERLAAEHHVSPATVKRAAKFAGLSSRAIAELVGCSREWVNRVSPKDVNSSQPARTVTGSDGKQYPATRRASGPTTPEEEEARTYGDVRRRQPRRRDGVREVVGVRHGRGLDTGAGVRIL